MCVLVVMSVGDIYCIGSLNIPQSLMSRDMPISGTTRPSDVLYNGQYTPIHTQYIHVYAYIHTRRKVAG